MFGHTHAWSVGVRCCVYSASTHDRYGFDVVFLNHTFIHDWLGFEVVFIVNS